MRKAYVLSVVAAWRVLHAGQPTTRECTICGIATVSPDSRVGLDLAAAIASKR
jgi:hypothetical protein